MESSALAGFFVYSTGEPKVKNFQEIAATAARLSELAGLLDKHGVIPPDEIDWIASAVFLRWSDSNEATKALVCVGSGLDVIFQDAQMSAPEPIPIGRVHKKLINLKP